MRAITAIIAGFVGMFVTNAIMAVAVIGPLVEERYEEVVASSPRLATLAAGYLLIAVVMALLYPRLQVGASWLSRSVIAGALVGLAAFPGTHTVISGYTTIDATGFVISGLLDSAGPIVGMIAIGYIYQRAETPRESVATA
jgi:Na+/H+ antiporter NhaC